MATVNATTLDRCKRTVFYRQNRARVKVRLPFSIVTIDEDVQFWEPQSCLGLVNEKGQRLSGANSDEVRLPRNMPLPRPGGNENPDRFCVWGYYGI